MAGDTAQLSKAELRRRQTLERRKHAAAEVLSTQPADLALRPGQSFAAQTLTQALPRELLDRGLIAFNQQGRPVVASYDPSLLAPNPQRGRLEDRGLDELARSLNDHGQQEPIIARLITPADRRRWPDAFRPDQIILILHGHRVFFAQPKSVLQKLRVELMLPDENEGDQEYIRRGLRRASIKMMHSQSYDIFDKVHLYMIWRQEFALEAPKDTDVAKYFEISRTEAQRVKTVANLDPTVRESILKSDRRPADEVVFTIANRPQEQQKDAFRRFGHLTVSAIRRIQQLEEGTSAKKHLAPPGRPRNYTLSIGNEDCPIATVSTILTPQQWKRRGGARAFWSALKALIGDKEARERVHKDLGG
jgi:hypothetical protein